MSQGFDIRALIGRSLVIKRIKLIPFAGESTIDFYVSDGTVSNAETIPARARLTRVVDDFITGAIIKFLINGSPIGIFPSDGEGGYPTDLDVDNIYYYFSEPVTSFDISVDAKVYTDIEAGTLGTQTFMKVMVECYIY